MSSNNPSNQNTNDNDENSSSPQNSSNTPNVETLKDVFADFEEFRKSVQKTLGTFSMRMKKCVKEHQRQLNEASKNNKRKKRQKNTNENRKPAGFALPTYLSPQLKKFLGVEEDLPRTEVTRRVIAYIKANNLVNPERKKELDLSKPEGRSLRELLQAPEDAVLTYFNLQTYLAPHYRDPSKPHPPPKNKKKTSNDGDNASPPPATSEQSNEAQPSVAPDAPKKKKKVVRKKKVSNNSEESKVLSVEA